jgi:hypothetical protein
MFIKLILTVQASCRNGATYLLRVHSLNFNHRTKGLTGRDRLLPSAARHKIELLPFVVDYPMSTMRNTLGLHFKWADRGEYGYLSWTESLNFAWNRAIRRRERGERRVYIFAGETSMLTTPDGQQAPFYQANALHKEFDVLGKDWSKHAFKEHTRIFTHEILSWGVLHDLLRAIQHVTIDQWVENGILALEPFLGKNERHLAEKSKLYTGCLSDRRALHKIAGPTQIRDEDLIISDRLALLYCRLDETKAPFNMFARFLALRKRPTTNRKLREWIARIYSGS